MSGAHHQFAIYIDGSPWSQNRDRMLWGVYSDRHRAMKALHGVRRRFPKRAFTLEGHDK